MSFQESDMDGMELCTHGERRKHCQECFDAAIVEAWPETTSGPVEWPEWKIEKECTKLLEEDGWRALRTDPVSDRGRGKGFGELGMADHMYIRYLTDADYIASLPMKTRAMVMWIEFKSASGKPKKHQIDWHTKERARGALTLIAGQDFPASVEGFRTWYRASGLNRGRV